VSYILALLLVAILGFLSGLLIQASPASAQARKACCN
jgi:VIT1/CCC1 family predicted Fe2+/Mn2+ transporter